MAIKSPMITPTSYLRGISQDDDPVIMFIIIIFGCLMCAVCIVQTHVSFYDKRQSFKSDEGLTGESTVITTHDVNSVRLRRIKSLQTFDDEDIYISVSPNSLAAVK